MTAWVLLVLFAIYGLVITGCVLILRWLRVSPRWRILVGFVIFGVAAGLLAAWQWPVDAIFIYNFPAAFLGNEAYIRSIQLIGDPTSENAHDTIPWLLRVPQVFLFASFVFWGLLGLLIQWIANHGSRIRRTKQLSTGLGIIAAVSLVVVALWLVFHGSGEPPPETSPISEKTGESRLTPAVELAPPATAAPGRLPSPVPPRAAVDYPLKAGNSWTYLVGRYDGFNPSEIASSTYVMTETVVAVSTDSSYYIATIRQDPSPEFAIYLPEDMKELPGGPPEPWQYWLIAEGNRLYREHLGLDLSTLHQEAAVEFVFPLQIGAKWYESEEMAKVNPDFKNNSMLHQVEQVDSVTVPAGKFENCYYMTEVIGGSSMEDWFCPGIGYVDRRNEHHGTPFGGRQVLLSYHLEK